MMMRTAGSSAGANLLCSQALFTHESTSQMLCSAGTCQASCDTSVLCMAVYCKKANQHMLHMYNLMRLTQPPLLLSPDIQETTGCACRAPLEAFCLCRDIKHLYHYYLHGPLGRRPGQSGPAMVNDGVLPNIIIQCIHNSHLKWRHNLVDVCDDMESKYLEVR